MHAKYLSLLGGLSWLIQTRLDIAVYVQALQRASQSPRVEHLIRLNKVTKWCKRTKAKILYVKLTSPVKLAVISDSAFRKEDKTGLAMRGAIVALCEQAIDHPGGKLQILEFWSRKQRRVTRSTYAAELHSVADAIEVGRMISYALSEIFLSKTPTAAELLKLEEGGSLLFDMEAMVDCRSLYDSLRQPELRTPSESSLVMVLHQIKELLVCGALSALWWIDTHDMISDGLNKGAVGRKPLLLVASTGEWTLVHPALAHREPVRGKVPGSIESVLGPTPEDRPHIDATAPTTTTTPTQRQHTNKNTTRHVHFSNNVEKR
jgi:hypothetical protein